MERFRSERGAVAVEFAVILPVLVSLLLGIVEFGRAYSNQTTITAAAREGARAMAIKNNATTARDAVRTASTSVTPAITNTQISISPSVCTPGANATVTITYRLNSLTNFFGAGWDLTGKGVMRCGG